MPYSYAINDFDWAAGEFPTREAALAAGRAYLAILARRGESGDGLHTVWTCRLRRPCPVDVIQGEDAIEQILSTEDFEIEQAEGWPDATPEQMNDLTSALRETFEKWMERYGLEPQFWLVEDVERHD